MNLAFYGFPSLLQPWLLSLGFGLIAFILGSRSLWFALPPLAVLLVLTAVAISDVVGPLPSDVRPIHAALLVAAPLSGLAIGLGGTLWVRASRKRAA